MSVPELSLLLRSGYTGDEVLREIAGRPLLEPLNDADEQALRAAGADDRTIAALRASQPVASESEADADRRRRAEAEQYKLQAWEASQQRLLEERRQEVNAKLASRAQQARQESLKAVAAQLHDKLVIRKGNQMVPYDNQVLAGKTLFLLYAASSASAACAKFTPWLVQFYQKFAPAHPNFETVLIPLEKTPADLAQTIDKQAMPWPALALEQMPGQPDLASLAKGIVPRLVLIDGSGQILADSSEKGKPLDFQRVLDALNR